MKNTKSEINALLNTIIKQGWLGHNGTWYIMDLNAVSASKFSDPLTKSWVQKDQYIWKNSHSKVFHTLS